ncbi:hypothetical protein [Cellvibrio mixtus]|uniref:hypothetical protein n=1 Tax=Cellvibrio mixtus TaxID=39650 RepID=UPI000586C933|nr:hypothetical protein [Cellvibrio mixtus]
MILPLQEIQNPELHYSSRADLGLSLEYQLGKILFICKKIESFLYKQKRSLYFYSTDCEDDYLIDSLVNNYSSLIEYYYSWVIFSYIGTIEHKKTTYTPIKNIDSEIEKEINRIFKYHSIGVLKKSTDSEYTDKCKKAFIKSFEFLFVGRFHEMYVLNNFLKHNRILSSYAPKFLFNGKSVCLPYVYINKHSSALLNASVFKVIFDLELNSGANVIVEPDSYYVDLFNKGKLIATIGNQKLFRVNEVDYLVSSSYVGITVESMVDVTYDLCLKIISIMTELKLGITRSLLDGFVLQINQRRSKDVDL